MKNIFCILSITLLMIFILHSNSYSEFKIVGYVPDWAGSPTYVQWDKVTHINYAFILPSNGTGGLTSPNSNILNTLVSQAHSRGVKVLVSIGGWNNGDDSRFHSVAANQTYINTFVANCTTLVKTFNLDGIDIDWEYPDAGTSADQYVTFMTSLANALHPKGKLLTAAVIGNPNNGIKNEIFNIVDFLNIMSYDGGTPHSTYAMASSNLRAWRARGLSKEKAILGVPFYGREPYTSYAQLCQMDPQAPFKDQVGNIYYNGIETIQKKTRLAADSGGGIMIWELSQDVSGQYSLLKAIYDAAPKTIIAFNNSSSFKPLCSVYSSINPFKHYYNINLNLSNSANVIVDIIDINGKIIKTLVQNRSLNAGQHEFVWDKRSNLGNIVGSGVYEYRVVLKNGTQNESYVKQLVVTK